MTKAEHVSKAQRAHANANSTQVYADTRVGLFQEALDHYRAAQDPSETGQGQFAQRITFCETKLSELLINELRNLTPPRPVQATVPVRLSKVFAPEQTPASVAAEARYAARRVQHQAAAAERTVRQEADRRDSKAIARLEKEQLDAKKDKQRKRNAKTVKKELNDIYKQQYEVEDKLVSCRKNVTQLELLRDSTRLKVSKLERQGDERSDKYQAAKRKADTAQTAYATAEAAFPQQKEDLDLAIAHLQDEIKEITQPKGYSPPSRFGFLRGVARRWSSFKDFSKKSWNSKGLKRKQEIIRLQQRIAARATGRVVDDL